MNIQGRILAQGLTGDDVRLLHTELTLLNLAVPDNERLAGLFGPATHAIVQQFQKQHNLPITGIVDAVSAKAINTAVEAQFPPAFTVSGGVYSTQRAGVGGLQIQVVDKNVGPDLHLALGISNDRGLYSLNYSPAAAFRQGKSAPDIQVRALAGNTLLGVSEVRYDATSNESLDVVVSDEAAAALPSEHTTLTGAIAAHYQGRLELDAEGVTYLANKTGWDGRAVALAALADQFSARTVPAGAPAPVIAPALFYALFRAGLPVDEDVLYRTDVKTLETVWTKAAEQGVIPSSITSLIPDAVKQFQTLSAQKLLSAPPLAGMSSLQQRLVASGLSVAQQQQFATLYTTNRTDLPAFWKAVGEAFGPGTAARLQLDGKLAVLTGNNAPLMQAVHGVVGSQGLSDPVQLVQAGYHRAAKWGELLNANTPIPEEIPGDTPEAKLENYAKRLADLLRLSYPTAAVAEMANRSDFPVSARVQVQAFLTEHQLEFDIGGQPVEEYIAGKNLKVTPEIVTQIKRLQRVYQITPSDQAMTGLLNRGIDAAYHVVQFDKEAFVRSFAPDLGGADQAGLVYERSQQVYNLTLNIATSYLLASNGVPLGVSPMMPGVKGAPGEGQVLRPAPRGSAAENAAAVIAYPTLEGLFGSMDFCSCDHCRSVLSPAAYLVDLLHFMDKEPSEPGMKNPQAALLERRPDIQHLPLTCENTNTALPYIDVVNETMEYFIANNVHPLSLADYAGHDTNGEASEDLLASPQFVMDTAYTILRGESFPLPLPFPQPLEYLRRLFETSGVSLPLVMERLRKTNHLEREANPYGWRDILMEDLGVSREEYEILTDSTTVPLWRMFGFRNGTTEADAIAGLSNAKLLARRLGVSYDDLVSLLQTRFINPNSDLIPKLTRLGVPFSMLKELKTNHDAATDARFDALVAQLAVAPDPADYDGDIKAWVKNPDNFARIMAIITLAVPAGNWAPSTSYIHGDCVRPTAAQEKAFLYYECATQGTSAASEPSPWPTTPGETYADGTVVWTCRDESTCHSFDNMALRYADPGKVTQNLSPASFIRILRFIRLWKKTGWSIDQTDAAICALYRMDQAPLAPDDIDSAAQLDVGFLTLLPRLGIAVRVMKALNLTTNRDLLPLLACWSDIGTHGDQALYRQMFLNAAILSQDAIFAENGYGDFLQKAAVPYDHPQATLAQPILDAAQGRLSYDNKQLIYHGVIDEATRDALKEVAGVSVAFQTAIDAIYTTQRLVTHSEALRAAFNVTAEEFDWILAAQRFNNMTPLTLANLTAVYRRGWLARTLRISVRELLLLSSLTGLDPFVLPDPTHPDILRLIALVQAMQDRSLKSAAALYLIWNQDLSGKSGPEPGRVSEFARMLRNGFIAIDDQFAVTEDPGGDVVRTLMALVYGQDAANAFLALLENTIELGVSYLHGTSTLDMAITTADPHIAYDDFRHRLSHQGLLSPSTQAALKAIPGVTAAFQNAVDSLAARSEDAIGSFFTRYPELKPFFDAYSTSADTLEKKQSVLLAGLQPELAKLRKRQQALQWFSAAAGVGLSFPQNLLDPEAAPYPLHAAGRVNRPALDDVIALQTQGLAARFFFGDTATGTADVSVPAAANLAYSAAGNNPLPTNPTPGAAISGIWQGRIETPEPGYYNLVIEADAGAAVSLTFDGKTPQLAQNGTIWRNATPLQLKAGTLYDITVTVQKLKDRLSVKWETPKQPREVIPGRYLYPPGILVPFSEVYIRFLKVVSLGSNLGLTANEMAHFATDPDFSQGGEGWMNLLPVSGNVPSHTAEDLLKPFEALLGFARIKADLSPDDERVLACLQNPAGATAAPDSQLFTLTHWDSASLTDVLTQFGGAIKDLVHFDMFRRVYDALAIIRPLGVSGEALIRATTNAPDGGIVRDFQSALRARYAATDWRDLIQPINDAMRRLQRDALVAYILHHLSANPDTAQIDTPDKLFEYFLMDVQMEPCMLTSRIRHALSSVQLFIERCLMNLEPFVSPASINAAQWTWMKRYRVWEANRKVFLFPENWLEPELRDNKSPFFKEIESELLQSDITDDSATAALLNYLAKLEEVAKLEPCGMYYVEPTAEQSEIIHLVARTAGAHRKYYYRRHESESGDWTPWEQIKLEIEDNPVIPVVWKDRLLLFWLRLLKKSPDVANKPAGHRPIVGLNTDDLPADPEVKVQAVLYWSEFYNGKWQPAKTSDVNLPTTVGSSLGNLFDRSALHLGVSVEGDALRVYIRDTPFRFYIYGTSHADTWPGSFLFYNTHSLPITGEVAPVPSPSAPVRQRDFVGDFKQDFGFTYSEVNGAPLTREILRTQIPFAVVNPRHELQNAWDAPFCFADSRHAFLVTTTEAPVWVRSYDDYGVLVNPPVVEAAQIPPLVVPTAPPPKPKVTEDAYIRQGLGTTLTVSYGDRQIGPSGAISDHSAKK
jgi:hypothetical protein